jgi:Complex I intermediate-associated protein 30 (CIA30)
VKTVLYFNPPPSPGAVLRSAIELPFKIIGGGNSTQASFPNNNLITTVPLRYTSSSPETTTTMPLQSTYTAPVLVSDATSDLGKRVVASLLQYGRQVRALVPDTASGKAALSSLPAASGARLEIVEQNMTSNSGSNAALGVRQLICPLNTATATSTVTSNNLQTLLSSLISSGALPKAPVQAIYTPDGLSPAKEWGPVDDVVMGGVSSSKFEVRQGAAEDGIAPAGVFTGNVTSANNGGFASTRTRNLTPPLNLTAYDGIELKVRGDGQRYKCVIKIDQSWDGVGYTTSFDTRGSGGVSKTNDDGSGGGGGEKNFSSWQTIQIPFSSLVPVFRAKTQYDAAPFDASRVTSIQLMLSKFEYDGRLNPSFREGQFALPVERIQAYIENKEEHRVVLVTPEGGNVDRDVEKFIKASGVPYRVMSVSDFT